MKTAVLLILVAAAVCQADLEVTVGNASVVVGEDAVVPCTYTTTSEIMPTITWSLIRKDGSKQRLYVYDKKTPSNSYSDAGAPVRTPSLTVNDDGSLVIAQTTIEDNKLYATLRCEVSLGSDGLQSKDAMFVAAVLPEQRPVTRINDYDPDKTGFDITDSSVNLGFCKSSNSYPAAVIEFYKNGAPLSVIEGIEGLEDDFLNDMLTSTSEDGVSVTTSKDLMKKVEISDHQAEFICNIKTVYGDKVYEMNYTMPKFNVNYQTSMASFDDSPKAYLGETVTLKCSADGYPEPTISINNEIGAELRVNVTADLDANEYVCKAHNSEMQAANPIESKPYTMNVLSLSKPSLAGIADEMVDYRLEEPIKIECSSEGNPTPNVMWYKGEDMVSKSGTLSIDSASFEDSGDYSCRGTNSEDKLAKSTNLKIDVKGMSRVGEEEITVAGKQNEKVRLVCTVNANPKPTFTWTGDDQGEAIDSKTPGYEYSNQLEVGPLTPELSKKEYTCTATGDDRTAITTKFTLPEIAAGSSSTAIIIAILVIILVLAVVLGVLYNKGYICKKSEEKGDVSAEGDLEGGMNNDEDAEAGNGAATKPAEDQPAVDNPEEEKLMTGNEEE